MIVKIPFSREIFNLNNKFFIADRVILHQSYIEGVDPPMGGWVNFFSNKFFKEIYGPDFFLNETMRLNGCLEKKLRSLDS